MHRTNTIEYTRTDTGMSNPESPTEYSFQRDLRVNHDGFAFASEDRVQ
jgi:hypothetical protein